MNSKFDKDLKFGKAGEKAIEEWLLGRANTLVLMDASDDSFFQSLDVDYLWQDVKKRIYKIEVKTDSMAHRTGNLAYELISSKGINSKGCFEKTKSDFIFYYLIATKEIYCIKTSRLQSYVKQNSSKLKLVNMGDNAQGYLIPIKTIIQKHIGKKIK